MVIDVMFPAAAIPAAREILDEWEAEHDRFYGTDFGSRRTSAGPCGYGMWADGGRWLTCGANYCALQILPHSVRLTYAGRRHGFGDMLLGARELLCAHWGRGSWVLVYQTTEPGWAPWETADTRAEVAGPA